MSDPTHDTKLNRRSLILGAVCLAGGAAALTRFTRGDAADPDAGPVFSSDQFALLGQVSETIIPATDTLGALGAGVPEFIREVLGEWGSTETRVAFTFFTAFSTRASSALRSNAPDTTVSTCGSGDASTKASLPWRSHSARSHPKLFMFLRMSPAVSSKVTNTPASS